MREELVDHRVEIKNFVFDIKVEMLSRQLDVARDVQTIGRGWRYESGSCVVSAPPVLSALPHLLCAMH